MSPESTPASVSPPSTDLDPFVEEVRKASEAARRLREQGSTNNSFESTERSFAKALESNSKFFKAAYQQ
jgi:hypothetical protein